MNVDYALMTDLYQLTMAQGYWNAGKTDEQACFHMYFREYPFKGGYAVACGMDQLAEMVETFRFSSEDVAYLAGLEAPGGGSLFDERFLEYLADFKLTCDIDAVREGTIVFPHEPLVRVTGSIMQCQLLETALLNCVNFQTLIATKAARVCRAAAGRPVAEFGLRRAQGLGGVWASRAAVVGGCASTSDVLAGKLFDIPVSGTHAHSWVMSFDDELTAFREYARAFPKTAFCWSIPTMLCRACATPSRSGLRCANAVSGLRASGSTRATSRGSRRWRAACSTKRVFSTAASSCRTILTSTPSSPSSTRVLL